jgi:RNA polymerase sigma-70 factor, ECF subfamily
MTPSTLAVPFPGMAPRNLDVRGRARNDRSWTEALSPRSRFESHVLPHLDAAYNLARWLTRDPHEAQDVAHDACVRALRYIHTLDESQARPWFLAIVRNAFYDWHRRNRPQDVDPWDDDVADSLPDERSPDPQREAIRGQDAHALDAALAALAPVHREVIVLRELQDLSYQEIAHVVGVPIGTVMSRLARARAQLRASPHLASVAADAAAGSAR